MSASTDVKRIAGAIAHVSREGLPPVLLATGPACLNTAAKAIAIARSYIADEGVFDLRAQPEFESDTSGGCTIVLTKADTLPMMAGSVEDTDLMVKPTSDPKKVAGAIAGRVRDGQKVSLIAYGAESVFYVIKSVAFARRYLYEEGVDLIFAPRFVTLELRDEAQRQALKFAVIQTEL